MKPAAILAVMQFVSVLVVTLNYRYCAKGKITATVITDIVIFALQFTVLKHVVAASSALEAAGYVVGSALGSVAGMLITRNLEDGTVERSGVPTEQSKLGAPHSA